MRNKPRKPGGIINKEYKLTEVTSYKELPRNYVGYDDNLEDAIIGINKKEEKLRERGYTVVRPLNIFRVTISNETHEMGKKKVTKPRLPYSMIAIELRQDGD